LGRGGEKRINTGLKEFVIGKAYKLRDADKTKKSAAVFSTGSILEEVSAACDMLEEQGYAVEQYSFPTVKPIDRAVIADCAARFQHIFAVEEHNIIGGLGGAVAEVMAELGTGAKLHRVGINDSYCVTVGTQQYLREQIGISASAIAEKVRYAIENE
jgi:transketolase